MQKAIRTKTPVQPTRIALEGVELTNPNGIAVDQSVGKLYIAQCDPDHSYIVVRWLEDRIISILTIAVELFLASWQAHAALQPLCRRQGHLQAEPLWRLR